MPHVLGALVNSKNIQIDGFILPGHVSAIIGSRPYEFLARSHKKRCVITGFEPLDILQAILMLIVQKAPKIEVQYTRVINKNGNKIALNVIKEVFKETDSVWRGIGLIERSGLGIRDEFGLFDVEKRFRPEGGRTEENKDCICGDVLKGMKMPLDCKLFKRSCNPENPIGSCMVSSEGTCAAYYKYG